ETVDFHFADRGADGEIMKRFSAASVAIVRNIRSPIESGRAQTRAREVGALEKFGERKSGAGMFRIDHHVIVENDPLRWNCAPNFFGQHLDRKWKQPRSQSVACIFDGGAVQVSVTRGGGRGSLGNLVSARGHDAN